MRAWIPFVFHTGSEPGTFVMAAAGTGSSGGACCRRHWPVRALPGCGQKEHDMPLRHVLIAGAAGLLLPAAAFAQGTITGAVRDTSGGVLPGVTVEAASPALIEKVRTAVTDENGQYRIIDLRPGPYSVTFTLPGFRVV